MDTNTKTFSFMSSTGWECCTRCSVLFCSVLITNGSIVFSQKPEEAKWIVAIGEEHGGLHYLQSDHSTTVGQSVSKPYVFFSESNRVYFGIWDWGMHAFLILFLIKLMLLNNQHPVLVISHYIYWTRSSEKEEI